MTPLTLRTPIVGALLATFVLASAACQGASAGPGEIEEDDLEPSEPTPTSCELSALGEAVHAGALAAAPGEHSVIPEALLSFDNVGEQALLRGGEIFSQMRELVASAKTSVDIAMFVWEVDSDAHRAIEAGLRDLAARLGPSEGAGDPVEVRLISNVIALSENALEVGEPLRRAINALALDPARVRVTVATRSHNGLDAMHHKLLVVDGAVAELGGANIEAVHDWKDGATPWHDSAYVVRGEIATALRSEFSRRWAEGREWRCDAAGCTSSPTERFYPSLETVGASESGANACTPMIALVRRPAGWVNNDIDNPQDLGYLAAFAEAERIIKIQSPNLNDDAAKRALLEAAAAGVRVELLLAYRFNELAASLPGQGGGNGTTVDRLYAAAIAELGLERACQVLDARWYAKDGVRVEGNVAGASHLKYASVDDQLTFVGSMNMDTQSWNQSGEVTVAIDSAEVNARFDETIFDSFFASGVPTGHCP